MHDKEAGNVSEDLGKLFLRVTLAILILLHGIAKVLNGVGSISGLLAKFGLPPVLAYLVYVGEVIGPLLVLFGIWARLGALLIAANMVVAVLLVHMPELTMLTKNGGWALELQAMFLVSALAVALLGAGRYSVGGMVGRWN